MPKKISEEEKKTRAEFEKFAKQTGLKFNDIDKAVKLAMRTAEFHNFIITWAAKHKANPQEIVAVMEIEKFRFMHALEQHSEALSYAYMSKSQKRPEVR